MANLFSADLGGFGKFGEGVLSESEGLGVIDGEEGLGDGVQLGVGVRAWGVLMVLRGLVGDGLLEF